MQTFSSIAPPLDRLTQPVDKRIDEVLSGVEATSPGNIPVPGTHEVKRIRPLPVLLGCEAVGRREVQAVDAAVAVELHQCSSLNDLPLAPARSRLLGLANSRMRPER